MTVEETLKQFDDINNKTFDEHSVSTEVRKLEPENFDEASFEMKCESLAFGFAENHKNGKGETFFGPRMQWFDKDSGKQLESPSIHLVTPEMIEYWKKRTYESTNPIMVSRYSGLVWDLEYKVSGKVASHEFCKKNIIANLEIALGGYFKHPIIAFGKLNRALVLAININSTEFIEKCKDAILIIEKKYAIDNKPGTWGYSLVLLNNKKVKLTAEEELSIVKDMEERLIHLVSESDSSSKLDPWAAKEAAIKLASYYRKKGLDKDTKRVLILVKDTFEKIIDDASPMQVAVWLEDIYNLLVDFNIKEEAEILLKQIREIGSKISSEMKTISHSFNLPKEEVDKYINTMISGELDDVLKRICVIYVPQKDKAKDEIFDLAKDAPLQFLVGQKIKDDDGRTLASIGSIENDIEGQIVYRISQNLRYFSFFLNIVLDEAIKKFSITPNAIIKFITKSPLIMNERISLIERGVKAYFEKDYVVAIHVLIPQIEQSIRRIIELGGGNVLKIKNGSHQLRTLDDIIRDSIINESLGEDLSIYLRILFTDNRGWNIRNSVSHGLTNPDFFNAAVADRVFHALLCLGLIEEKQ